MPSLQLGIRKQKDNVMSQDIANEALLVNSESTVSQNQETVKPSGITHGFDSGYAMAYGLEEAIMIRHFQFWIQTNANRGQNFRDGRYWTYDRIIDFPNHFCYFTPKQCRRILTSLIRQNVLIKSEYNKNWSDRTAWYAFRDQDHFVQNIKPPKTALPHWNPQGESVAFKEKSTVLPKRASPICPNGHLTDSQMGNCIYSTDKNADKNTNTPSLMVPDPGTEQRVEKSSSMSDKKIRPESFHAPVLETGQLMIEAMRIVKPDFSAQNGKLLGMLNEIDRMIRLDKRTPEKIIEVFRWALADDFWADKMFRPNPAKYLRDKFDQLEMKMQSKPPETNKVDRRTKDKDGKPVDRPEYKDLF
jgi:hypothetical protein